MADEPTGEPSRVSVEEPRESAYWARTFQVPVEQVKEAVAAVGDDPARVAERLGKPWPDPESGIV